MLYHFHHCNSTEPLLGEWWLVHDKEHMCHIVQAKFRITVESIIRTFNGTIVCPSDNSWFRLGNISKKKPKKTKTSQSLVVFHWLNGKVEYTIN